MCKKTVAAQREKAVAIAMEARPAMRYASIEQQLYNALEVLFMLQDIVDAKHPEYSKKIRGATKLVDKVACDF